MLMYFRNDSTLFDIKSFGIRIVLHFISIQAIPSVMINQYQYQMTIMSNGIISRSRKSIL